MKTAKTSLLFALLLGLLPAAYAEDYDDKTYQNLITQCTRNQLDSCVTLGIWTRDYLESPADAYLPLKKACDGKNMKGCNVLANLYLDPYSGLGMDYPKALELYRKACKGGYDNACRNAKETEEEMRNQTRRKTAQPNAKSGWRHCNVPAWAKTMPLAGPYNANCNADTEAAVV